MDLGILNAGALGLALLTAGVAGDAGTSPGGDALVGQRLWASAAPVARYGDAPRFGDLALEDLGRVAAVVTGPDGRPEGLVVAVGGLWGIGAREVDVAMDGVLMIEDDGATRLVVDLSA